jgi:hypothetical protein
MTLPLMPAMGIPSDKMDMCPFNSGYRTHVRLARSRHLLQVVLDGLRAVKTGRVGEKECRKVT